MTLIEVMIVSLIMGVLAFAMMTMSSNQMKSNNFSEFQNKREQLRLVLLGQVLNGSDNCKCLFTGATEFSAAAPSPGVTLTGYTAPTALGKFSPADCSGGVPAPFVNAAGVDGLKLASVSLANITFTGGTYSGDFIVGLRSAKDVLGPKDLQLKIPVSITTVPGTAGNVVFQSCTVGAAAPPVDKTLEVIKAKSNIYGGYLSPTYGGGGGGGQVFSTCGGGSYVYGFDGNKGTNLDSIRVGCRTYDNATTSIGAYAGGGGGSAFPLIACPTGSFANGMIIRTGSVVDALALKCKNPVTSATSVTASGGGTGGSASTWNCPTGAYIFEFRAYYGNKMDSLQAVCADMPL